MDFAEPRPQAPPGSDPEAAAAVIVYATWPLFVATRLLGLAPLRCAASPPRWSRSAGWALYSWGLTALLVAAMIASLYTTMPTSQVQTFTGSLFRADVFVFSVHCLNDSVAVGLLVLANVKARSVAEALDQLVRCAAALLAGRAGRAGRLWTRWVAAQVGGTLLCLVACLLILGVQEERRSPYAEAAPFALLGLVHLASLPLQLFFCLLFGNQVALLWLSVRAVNRRLEAMIRGLPLVRGGLHPPALVAAPEGRSSVDILLPTVFPSQLSRSPTPRWANPSRATFFDKGKPMLLPDEPSHLHGEVRDVHALHAQVRYSLSLLTSAHSIQLILLALISFTGVTTSLYIWFTSRDVDSVLALARSGLVSLFLFGVLTAGELVKRESQFTMRHTQKLLIYHKMDPVTRLELRRFSQQHLNQGLQVSVYGFLSLDYTMIQGIIGSVTTYLIMVIQLSPEE